MKRNKGVSPLIATVMLLAFVVAIAAMTSTFFTNFTKDQTGQVENKGQRTIDCSMGNLNIQKDSIDTDSSDGNISFDLKNNGYIDVDNLILIAYNRSGDFSEPISYNSSELSEEGIIQGNVIRLKSPHPNGNITKLTIKSEQCPSVEDTVVDEDLDGVWING